MNDEETGATVRVIEALAAENKRLREEIISLREQLARDEAQRIERR